MKSDKTKMMQIETMAYLMVHLISCKIQEVVESHYHQYPEQTQNKNQNIYFQVKCVVT